MENEINTSAEAQAAEAFLDTPRSYVIGDTETCGFGKMKIPCEIGLLEFNPHTFEVIDTIESLINPGIEIPQKVIDIHGITNEMVVDSPTFEQFRDITLGGGMPGRVTMVCHNVAFDLDMLVPLGHIERTVCTVEESRLCIHDSPSHKLVDLVKHFGFPDHGAHRALKDCFSVLHLLQEICRRTGRTVDQLADTEVREVLIMPFGMWKGTLMHLVPKQYLQWLTEPGRAISPNLRRSAEKALALQ